MKILLKLLEALDRRLNWYLEAMETAYRAGDYGKSAALSSEWAKLTRMDDASRAGDYGEAAALRSEWEKLTKGNI